MFVRRPAPSLSEDSFTTPKPRRSRTGTPSLSRPPSFLDRKPEPTKPRSGSIYKNPLLGSAKRMINSLRPALDHQNYIDNMMFRIKVATELDEARVKETPHQIPANLLSLINQESEQSVESALVARELDLPQMLIGDEVGPKPRPRKALSSVKRIEAPWRSKSNFVSPSAQQQITFNNFALMALDPPKTPPAPKPADRPETPRPQSKGKARTPGKSEKPKSRGSERGHKFLYYQKPLGPSRSSPKLKYIHETQFYKPSSKPLPAATKPRTATFSAHSPDSGPGKYLMERFPPVSARRMTHDGYDPVASLSRMERQRKEALQAASRPSTSQRMNYGNVRTPAPKAATKSTVYLPNPSVSSAKSPRMPERLSKVQKFQKLQVELQNMQRQQIQRRLHPSMMFPIHVPGPKQDNVYIGNYESSSDED